MTSDNTIRDEFYGTIPAENNSLHARGCVLCGAAYDRTRHDGPHAGTDYCEDCLVKHRRSKGALDDEITRRKSLATNTGERGD